MISASFNELERAILEHIAKDYSIDSLTRQIHSATLKERNHTGHGFYIYFRVSKVLPRIEAGDIGEEKVIHGPFINSKGVDIGGGCLIFLQDGYIDCLEMYAYGDRFNEHISEFELSGSHKRPTWIKRFWGRLVYSYRVITGKWPT